MGCMGNLDVEGFLVYFIKIWGGVFRGCFKSYIVVFDI